MELLSETRDTILTMDLDIMVDDGEEGNVQLGVVDSTVLQQESNLRELVL